CATLCLCGSGLTAPNMLRRPPAAPRSRRRARRQLPRYDKILLDVADDAGDRFFDRQPVGIDGQLGGVRRLIGRGDAGELRDLAAARLLVEALGVAPLAGVEIGMDVDLVKRVLGSGARAPAVGP